MILTGQSGSRDVYLRRSLRWGPLVREVSRRGAGRCFCGRWGAGGQRATGTCSPEAPAQPALRGRVSQKGVLSDFPNRPAEAGVGPAAPSEAWELEPEARAGSLRPRRRGHRGCPVQYRFLLSYSALSIKFTYRKCEVRCLCVQSWAATRTSNFTTFSFITPEGNPVPTSSPRTPHPQPWATANPLLVPVDSTILHMLKIISCSFEVQVSLFVLCFFW